MPNTDLEKVISIIPAWKGAGEINCEKIGGLTNVNYKVWVDRQPYFVRISGNNVESLGIKRINEGKILQAASDAGLCPEVVKFVLPEGHLVTRWVDGCHWTPEEFRTSTNIQRLTQTVKSIHSLPDNGTVFSPFRKAEDFLEKINQYGFEKPGDQADLKMMIDSILHDQTGDPGDWKKLCHNDLFSVNYLIAGDMIKVVDWEFAGMGDLYFDLATIVYTHDSDGPISEELEEEMLKYYFGEVTPANRIRLAGMKFMLMLFNGLWGYMQNALLKMNLIPTPEGFDYLEFAQSVFSNDLAQCGKTYRELKKKPLSIS